MVTSLAVCWKNLLWLTAMTTEPREDFSQFETRRITVGAVTKEQLLVQLKEAQVQLNDAAKILFESVLFTTFAARRDLNVMELSVSDLKFPQGATMPELQAAAITLGLCLPPLEMQKHILKSC